MTKDTYIKARVNPEIKQIFEERCAFLQLSPSQVQRDLVNNHIAVHKSVHEVQVIASRCTYPQNFALHAKLIGYPITKNFAFDIPQHKGWLIHALHSEWSISRPGEPDLGLVSSNVWQGRASRISEDSVPIERIEYDLLVLFHQIAVQVAELQEQPQL